MRKCKIIGLTGQSGAGKSTVAQFFVNEGIAVINADSIVKELYCADSFCLKILSLQFGDEIINEDGSLNRTFLAEIVFSSKEKLDLLNSIIHPFVMSRFLDKTKEALKRGKRLVVFDAPQLFESKADLICDEIIAVTASREKRLQRICLRDGISQKQAEKRINAQYNEDFFRANCDYIIENDCDLMSLKDKTLSVINSI